VTGWRVGQAARGRCTRRVRHVPLLLAAVLLAACAQSPGRPQSRTATPGAEITAAGLRAHMSVLAHDSLEGRGAGYRGEERAAEYIAQEFARIGLLPAGDVWAAGARSFFQRFDLHPRGALRPFETLPSRNVIGLLEGSDPALHAQVVVVGAHYDGQGRAGEADMGRRPPPPGSRDSIWNSANDNGSGTVALLAVAEAMARGERPRRSVLFIAFGAEEHGLAGSLHYTASPTIAWERHVAMINLEMIGWEPDLPVNVRATATSADWPALLETVRERTGIPNTVNVPELTNDTDHYGFGVRGVPAVHYGVPGTREHYHAATDRIEHIAFDALARRSRHILALTREVANRDLPPVYSWRHPPDLGVTGTPVTPDERQALRLPAGELGIKLNAVAAGLPAHAAGLLPGDVLVAVGGAALPAGEPWQRTLRDRLLAAGDTLMVEYVRAGERRTRSIPTSP
jgi:acetylornithine deacetylase/succinyl-diaminopimelate desuccinylase-like protein